MKSYKNLYEKVYSLENLFLAYKKARKGKTKKDYVRNFEKKKIRYLLLLKKELKNLTYRPKPIRTFIIRDPKTRKIGISAFRDRIIHHALCNIIEPIFDKIFIYDSCANRKGKGTSLALQRFDRFKRKVSKNGKLVKNDFNSNQVKGYYLKADIKHYFHEIDHKILMKILSRKIKDEKVLWLIKQILNNNNPKVKGKGMPLGNLTSQFFANIYLNELDYFIKHNLKAKYYLRYVDDFIILHPNKRILEYYKIKINEFLKRELKIELHKDKSKIKPLARGITFVGYRIFYYYKLLRKRNIKKIIQKVTDLKIKFASREISYEEAVCSFAGINGYMKFANTYKFGMRFISISQIKQKI